MQTHPKKRKTQHDKFVDAARGVGADEIEDAFKDALKKIAPKAEEGMIVR